MIERKEEKRVKLCRKNYIVLRVHIHCEHQYDPTELPDYTTVLELLPLAHWVEPRLATLACR